MMANLVPLGRHTSRAWSSPAVAPTQLVFRDLPLLAKVHVIFCLFCQSCISSDCIPLFSFP